MSIAVKSNGNVWMRSGGGVWSSPAAGGGSGLAYNQQLPQALGLDAMDYYRSSCAFINLIHGTRAAWEGTGSASVDANGWITNMPNGQSVSKLVLFHITYPSGYVKPGAYVIKWTGALSVTLSSGVATGITNGTNRVDFTLPALSASNSRGNFITVVVTNSSGSAASVNDIAIMHADDEADYDAGEIFSRDFLQSLENAKIIRFMDWLTTNEVSFNPDPIVDFADFPTESYCNWASRIPPSLIGKLALKTGKDIWVNFPGRATQTCMNSMADAIGNAATAAWTGKAYVSFSNETWNAIFGQMVYLRDTKSATLSVVNYLGNSSTDTIDKISNATAHGCLQAWSAMETELGTSRVVRVFEGFATYWDFIAGAWEYTDPGVISAGTKFKNIAHAYAPAPYFDLVRGGVYGAPSDMSQRAQIENKYYLQNDAWWNNVFLAGQDYIMGYVSGDRTRLDAVNSSLQLLAYEGGHHCQVAKGEATYSGTVNTGTNTVDFASSIDSFFDNNDFVAYGYNGGTTPFSGAGHWLDYPIKKVGTTSFRIYADQAAYDADTPLTLTSGTFDWDNITRLVALGNRYKELLDSTNGVSWYQTYHDNLKTAGGEILMQFVNSGGYSTMDNEGGSYEFSWGLKRSIWELDSAYPRAQWFRGGAARDTANTFTSGHSLTDTTATAGFSVYLHDIATSLSKTHDWEQQIGIGSPLRQRTSGSSVVNPPVAGYQSGKRADQSDWNSTTSVITELRVPTQVTGGYTHLIVAERHDTFNVLMFENTVKYLKHIHDLLIEGNNAANTYLFHSWWWCDYADPAGFVTFERLHQRLFEAVADRINVTLSDNGRTDRIINLPAGGALAELVHQATTGTVAGVTQGTTADTMGVIFSDNVHLDAPGMYYIACVAYACVYRRSPVGASYPTGVTATQAASLQSLAWTYVQDYYDGFYAKPLHEHKTWTQAFCTTSYDRGVTLRAAIGEPAFDSPGSASFCSTTFGDTDDDNPLNYTRSTDSAYWLTAPP